MIKDNLKSKIAKEVPLDHFGKGLAYYLKNMSKGKVVFKPWLEPSEFNDE